MRTQYRFDLSVLNRKLQYKRATQTDRADCPGLLFPYPFIWTHLSGPSLDTVNAVSNTNINCDSHIRYVINSTKNFLQTNCTLISTIKF